VLRDTTSDTGVSPTSEQQLAVTLDVYWCDAHGTYASGWAHYSGAPVQRLTLETRSGRKKTTVARRPDLPPFFSDSVAMESAGFAVYLPGPPDVELVFSGVIGPQSVRCVVPVPRHPLPIVPSAVAGRAWADALTAAVAAAPDGPVLALGVRTAQAENDQRLRAWFPGREVIGVDIHPGLGVQVVADVHELETYFAAESAAIIYSGSLLEHVAAPWLVARACSGVLKPGGYAMHHVPWAWPTHAAPNDFWRISQEGLQLLFGRSMGFEVIESGSEVDVRMHVEPVSLARVEPRAALIGFGTTFSAAASWIVSRKVGDPEGAAEWPYRGTMTAELAARYPVDGLGSPSGRSPSVVRNTVGCRAYNDESVSDPP